MNLQFLFSLLLDINKLDLFCRFGRLCMIDVGVNSCVPFS